MNSKDLNIFIYTHKDFTCPVHNDVYKILTENKLHDEYPLFQFDVRNGDNIQRMGASYSELKGMYWVWKNLGGILPPYVGFCHYRRYFSFLDEPVLPDDGGVCTFTPDPLFCNGKPQNVFTQYIFMHNVKDLNRCRAILDELHPEYIGTFDYVMESCHELYAGNSFIMSRGDFMEYAEWLFSILFEFDRRVWLTCYEDVIRMVRRRGEYDKGTYAIGYDNINTPEYQARIQGFLAERLMTVYIEHNFHGRIKTFKCYEPI